MSEWTIKKNQEGPKERLLNPLEKNWNQKPNKLTSKLNILVMNQIIKRMSDAVFNESNLQTIFGVETRFVPINEALEIVNEIYNFLKNSQDFQAGLDLAINEINTYQNIKNIDIKISTIAYHIIANTKVLASPDEEGLPIKFFVSKTTSP